MPTTHHRGVNSYLDGEYKTNAIRNNIILSKSKYDSYFDVILHHERATIKKRASYFITFMMWILRRNITGFYF